MKPIKDECEKIQNYSKNIRLQKKHWMIKKEKRPLIGHPSKKDPPKSIADPESNLSIAKQELRKTMVLLKLLNIKVHLHPNIYNATTQNKEKNRTYD